MDSPVSLRMLSCCFSSSGKLEGDYEVILKDLSYEKKVSIFGDFGKPGGDWESKACKWKEFVIEDQYERWEVAEKQRVNEFVIKFDVDGKTYWDNNGGKNYILPKESGFFVILGNEFPIALGSASFINAIFKVQIAVQNLAYKKDVSVVFTQDGWKSHKVIDAVHSWQMVSGVDVFSCQTKLASSSPVEFALCCKMNGQEYWDNNFYQNYKVKAQTVIFQKAGTEDGKEDLWDSPSTKNISHKPKKSHESQSVVASATKDTQQLSASKIEI